MKIKIEDLGRNIWKKAKRDYALRYPNPNWRGNLDKFWKDFGDAYNMKVVISGYNMGFPIIETIEFNDDKSYVYFLLRWS
jgi:hypothetical protein